MTEDEFRSAIDWSENRINNQLDLDKQELLCKLQAKNRTYIKNPRLYQYTFAYAELVNKAKRRMAMEADALETLFYEERGLL